MLPLLQLLALNVRRRVGGGLLNGSGLEGQQQQQQGRAEQALVEPSRCSSSSSIRRGGKCSNSSAYLSSRSARCSSLVISSSSSSHVRSRQGWQQHTLPQLRQQQQLLEGPMSCAAPPRQAMQER